MKKNFKIILVVTLLFVSLCCKALLTYEIINEAWMFDVHTEAFLGLKAEYFIYAVDAVLTVMIFSFAEKRMKRLYSKIILIISTVMFYLLFVSAFNYLWQSIELNTMLKWEEPLYNPFYLAIGGFRCYFETGRPQYHTAIILLAVILSTIVVLRRYKDYISLKAKTVLMKRAEKSNNFSTFYYDLILIFFKNYVSLNEFEQIRDNYIKDKLETESYFLSEKFDSIEQMILLREKQ